MHDSVALNSYVSISNSFSLSGVLIMSLGTGRRVRAGDTDFNSLFGCCPYLYCYWTKKKKKSPQAKILYIANKIVFPWFLSAWVPQGTDSRFMSMNKTYCFQIYFFIAKKKKKKVGAELETKATKNNSDSNFGFQHNCWVEYRPPCTQLFEEDSLILGLLLKLLHIMACTHMNTDLLMYTHAFLFTQWADVSAVCVFPISMIHS